MLKLEKKKYQKEILIHMRREEGWCNRLFLKALAIALGCHLAGIIFFQIQPFRLLHPAHLPPAIVEIELPMVSQTAVAVSSENLPISYRLPLPPKYEIPKLSLLIKTTPEMPLAWRPTVSLERKQTRLMPSQPIIQIPPMMVWEVSGDLAQLKTEIKKEIAISNIKQNIYLRYTLHVDNGTGRVLAFTLEDGLDDNMVRKEVEQLIAQLQFLPTKGTVTTGILEIAFEGGGS